VKEKFVNLLAVRLARRESLSSLEGKGVQDEKYDEDGR
jgi:hypothetical protein